MRISDWSSDVCSSDLYLLGKIGYFDASFRIPMIIRNPDRPADATRGEIVDRYTETVDTMPTILEWIGAEIPRQCDRSEEHTSELQSQMRISHAAFCLIHKTEQNNTIQHCTHFNTS